MKCKCGHEKEEHCSLNDNTRVCLQFVNPYNCDCKQFIPNHSPSSHVTEDKDPDDETEVTELLSKPSDSGSAFILSDKRKELIRTNSFGKPTYCIGWNDAIKRCNEQDAEFIRLLKEDLQPLRYGIRVEQLNRIHQMIDKLAGDLK